MPQSLKMEVVDEVNDEELGTIPDPTPSPRHATTTIADEPKAKRKKTSNATERFSIKSTEEVQSIECVKHKKSTLYQSWGAQVFQGKPLFSYELYTSSTAAAA
jgi:hypothetical protein